MACKGCAERRAWVRARARNVKNKVLSPTTSEKLLAKKNKNPKSIVL
jgi:hypothetical protein